MSDVSFIQSAKQEAYEYRIRVYEAWRKKYANEYPNLPDPYATGFDYDKDVPYQVRSLVKSATFKNLGIQYQSVTSKILAELWDAYINNLYHGDNEQYETFKDYVDNEVAQYFGDIAYSHLNAMRLTVERAISYVHANPINLGDGNKVTAEHIVFGMNASQIDNLNRAGSHMTDDKEQNDDLLKKAITESPKDFRNTLSGKITIMIKAYHQYHNGMHTIVIPNITPEEYKVLTKQAKEIMDISDTLPDGLELDFIGE